MDRGGSLQGSEEKGAERLMDEYLKVLGYHRKKIAKDGSCLFRAVAEQVLNCQSLHTEVRAKCVEFLKRNREIYEAFIEGDFEDYLLKLQDPQQWVGEVEINALAVMYKRDFMIYQVPGQPAVNITANNFKDKVRLCFLNGNHYDSVYPIERVKNAALCQSVLYELLYDNVFKVDRSMLGMCQRTSRATDHLSDDNLAVCASSDESDLDADETLRVENETSSSTSRHRQNFRGRGRGRQLPERVRRSLNPTLFRNVDYDVWLKTKRAQQKMDFCIAAGMQYTAGDPCQVRLEGSGRTYNATVKEVAPNNSVVTVFIEELGKRQVPLWSLRPPSDENSWSTVVNREKRLSNGHGDWEERGRGRGRGKSVPASSSVATATAPGPSGRMLKQNSWPPQAPVEEHVGTRANRKSVSPVDLAFGLTKDERLAKEEEKRNVALVEIQLRDEQSFPSLGTVTTTPVIQCETGRKKRSQRNKTRSPVEDAGALSPSAGERPKSSTPPLTTAAATTNTTIPANPAPSTNPPPPSQPVNSSPAWLSSIKAPTTSNLAAAAPAAPAPAPPLPQADKPSAPSYASAAPPSSPVLLPSVPSSASLFSFITPVLPAASSPPAPSSFSSKLPTSSSSSPPPPSSLPPPTFIAPIAPSPVSAQGFLPRSSPPVASLPRSPSPTSLPVSSSSLVHQAPQVHEASAAPARTLSSLPDVGGTQIQVQVQTQSPASLPPNHIQMPQMQTEAQSSLPYLQPQPYTEVPTLPQNQIQMQASVPHLQSQYLPQSQSHPGAPYPSAAPPHIHSPAQAPPPALSGSPNPLSLQTQPPNAQSPADAPPPPAQPEPHLPASLHPHLQPPPHPLLTPHHLQSIPGAVPLQQLSQLYQDLLYPGFPQGEKGDMAPTPQYSSSKSGDDLPQDVNILRFFFNLGVKAYSMPMYQPYIYLLPLQHAHTLQPCLPSRSPSPTPQYAPPNPPAVHQEVYPHPHYPTPTPQYDHHVAPQQAPPIDRPHPGEPAPNPAAGYPVAQPMPHRVPWQPHQLPPGRNHGYPQRFPAPSPPYPTPTPPPPSSAQGYHPVQGHPLYPQYPQASSLGYPAPASPDKLQGSHGPVEQQHRHGNGDTAPGPGTLEGPAAASVKSRTMVVPGVSGFGLKKEQGDSLTPVLLVDPPLNNTPIVAWVSEAEHKDGSVSMTTMQTPSSTPGSPGRYDRVPKRSVAHGDHGAPGRTYGGHKPGKGYSAHDAGYPETVAMAEPLSVGCSTEDTWEESEGFKPPPPNHRGSRRSYRGGGGRGRGGNRRRQGAESGSGLWFSSSYQGRGR